MRIGIRECGYFSEAYVEKELESMEGEPLNEALMDVFKNSVSQRDTDILNVVRHSEINCGYSQDSKIAVLEKDINKKQSEKETVEKLKQDIKILISATEDAVGQVTLQQYYKDGKHEGKEFLLKMLDDLSNGAFVFS